MTDIQNSDDFAAIMEALEKYNEGAAAANSSVMRPSFHAKATIYSVDEKSDLSGGSVEEFLFNPVDNDLPQSPNAVATVSKIDIVGCVASARIDTENLAGMKFTDFMQLVKTNGRWQVISKVFHGH